MLDKGMVYFAWGVSHVWIIDPIERKVWIQTKGNPEGVAVDADGSLNALDIEIPLAELFTESR